VFGAGGEPLYLTVNGVSTYSHQDALGSTIALSSATAGSTLGKITAEFAYDAFGQPAVPVTSTFGYAGQRVDPTTGLEYDRARFYSPALGRFYAPDPIGYKGGSNLYAYVGGNPVNYVDPFGLAPNDKTYGLPKAFWNWYHRQRKRPGDPDLSKDEAQQECDDWKKMGQPGPESPGSIPEDDDSNDKSNSFAPPPWLPLLLLLPVPGNPIYGGL